MIWHRRALIGRDRELARARAHLEAGVSLLTLLGQGGHGKTRLAHELVAGRRDDALFVDLTAASAGSGEGIVGALTAALGVGGRSGRSLDLVAEQLGRMGLALVVLDNLEHLLPSAADELASLQARTAVQWVVTTRVLVGLPGETVLRILPLGPSDAEALFLSCVPPLSEPVSPGPVLTRLLAHLEGIPLAIELAAARLQVLPLAELAARAAGAETLDVLRDPARPARHSSIGATLADSWDLLPADARATLSTLSVFRDGIALDAAVGVLQADEVSVLDALQTLVRHALVARVPHAGGTPRYAMLELVRAFAARRLDDPIATGDRHAAWFASAALAWQDDLDEAAPVRERCRAELGNLLAARAHAEAHGTAEALLHITAGLSRIAFIHLPVSHTEALMSPALAGTEDGNAMELRVRLTRALARLQRGDSELAESDLNEAARLAGSVQDHELLRRVATHQWTLALAGGDLDAADDAIKAVLTTAPDIDPATRCRALGELAVNEAIRGQRTSAEAHLVAARALADLHDPGVVGHLARMEGEVAWLAGDHAAAHRHFDLSATSLGDLDLKVPELRCVAQASAAALCLGHDPASVLEILRARSVSAPTPAERPLGLVLAIAMHLAGDPSDAVRAVLGHARVPANRYPLVVAFAAAATAVEGLVRAVDGEHGADVLTRIEDALVTLEAAPWVDAPRCLQPVRELLVGAHGPDLSAHGMAGPQAMVAVAARRLRDQRDAARRAWAFRLDGTWFRGPEVEPVDLSHRAVVARVLAHLVDLRRHAPGRGADVDDLAAAGWPDEKLIPSAARNRVHVALSTLRKAGLATLERHEGAYRLDPQTPITIESE